MKSAFYKILSGHSCLLMILLLVSGLVNGQTIVTDRPDQTESSSTIEKGSIQLESGILIGFNEVKGETVRQLLAPTTLFRIGIVDVLELRVVNQFESIGYQKSKKEYSGITDLEVGVKLQLLRKENINAEVAFLSHLVIPTGSPNHTNDRFGTINKLSVSHIICDAVGIGYNLGYDNPGRGNGDLTYSIALGIGITKKAGVYAESYGSLIEFEKHESNFDAGITYLVKDNLQLDFSFGSGINYTMNYSSLGVSWNISNKN